MMRLSDIPRVKSNLGRLREVLAVLGRYGLAEGLRGLNYDWLQGSLVSFDGQRLGDLTREARIRMALAELGTTFIKLGQMLSTRVDLIGPELAAELAQLQSETPVDSAERVRKTIEEELGKPPEQLYGEFDWNALGSASIAQVHRARLHSGEEVVVKVQHEGVAARVTADLDILMILAEMAERHVSELRSYQPIATAAEFRRSLLRELDFTRERQNLERFIANFVAQSDVRFPRPFPELSGRRVLTMERFHGTAVTNRASLQACGADLSSLALRGATMFLDMVFRDGFYHADPHPGNLMLLDDGAIGVLDCGMVGHLDGALRDEVEMLVLAATRGDVEDLTDTVVRLGSVPPDFDERGLRTELGQIVADYLGQTLKDFDLSGALNGVTEIIRRHHIVLPAALTMLLRLLVMLEGTARQLDPEFCLAEILEPYYVKAVKRRLSPTALMHRMQRAYRDWDRLIGSLPRDLGAVLTRLRRGSFDIHLEHRRLETAVNRLVLGILSAALFIGSAQLWSRGAPPAIRGISVFGVLGCVAALLLGYRLLVAVRGSQDTRPRR